MRISAGESAHFSYSKSNAICIYYKCVCSLYPRRVSKLTPLRVLIVEDSENDTLLLLRLLRKGGYEPTCRQVQTEATMRKALQEEAWDLILSDHDMPRFSALEALRIFQESGLEIPFIIVSGALEDEIAGAAIRAGARDFIRKKDLKYLLPAVQRELGQGHYPR